jgi:hypothetical protein
MYYGIEYTARRVGSVAKAVRCERCGSDYSYTMTRKAKGIGHSPGALRNAAAQAEAAEIAEKKVAKKLAREAEAVPCPDCGWVQTSMVIAVRRQAYRWLFNTAVTIAILGGISTIFALVGATDTFQKSVESDQVAGVAGCFVGGIVGAAVLMAARHMLSLLINPNRHYENRRPAISR